MSEKIFKADLFCSDVQIDLICDIKIKSTIYHTLLKVMKFGFKFSHVKNKNNLSKLFELSTFSYPSKFL